MGCVSPVDIFILRSRGNWLIGQHHGSSHVLAPLGHEKHCPKYRGSALLVDDATRQRDLWNARLAASLTATGLLKVDYETTTNCSLTHGRRLRRCKSIKVDKAFFPKSARQLEEAVDYCNPQKIATYPAWLEKHSVSQSELLDVMGEPGNGGFVVIEGGEETVDDVSELTGFCLNRTGEAAIRLYFCREEGEG